MARFLPQNLLEKNVSFSENFLYVLNGWPLTPYKNSENFNASICYETQTNHFGSFFVQKSFAQVFSPKCHLSQF